MRRTPKRNPNVSNGSNGTSSPELDAVGNLPGGEPLVVENRPLTPFPPRTEQPGHQAIEIEPQLDQSINIDTLAEELSELPFAMPVRSASSSLRRTHQRGDINLPEDEIPLLQRAMPSSAHRAPIASTEELPSISPVHSTSSSIRNPAPSSSESSSFGGIPPIPLSPIVHILYPVQRNPSPQLTHSEFANEGPACEHLIRYVREEHRLAYQQTQAPSISCGLYDVLAGTLIPLLPMMDRPTLDFETDESEERAVGHEARREVHDKRKTKELNRKEYRCLGYSLTLCAAVIIGLYITIIFIEYVEQVKKLPDVPIEHPSPKK